MLADQTDGDVLDLDGILEGAQALDQGDEKLTLGGHGMTPAF